MTDPHGQPAPPTLAVHRLTLTDFRSYAHLRLAVDARPVVLTGANGAGKTNLLEALSYLVPGRGLRRDRLSAASRRAPGDDPAGPPRPWAVAARLEGPDGPVDAGTGLDPEAVQAARTERRLVRLDGAPARSQAALAEHVALQWLTPQMDRLFQDGAAARRRFLDRLVFGFDPAHAGRVSGYEHALRERARLLRDGPRDAAWLAALEDTMATRGVAVAAARLDMVDRLRDAAAADGDGDGHGGPFPAADMDVEGAVESWLRSGPALGAEDRLRDALAADRGRDADSGGAAHGPHRSDLVVHHRAKGMPAADCSTGEQKALLIAIVLANARLQAAARGRVPILLLDEVAAHLDQARRGALFERLLDLGTQAWMTGTDGALFAPLGDRAQHLLVADGAVSVR